VSREVDADVDLSAYHICLTLFSGCVLGYLFLLNPLNGHIIVVVDMEGKTWRIICKPCGAEMSIHQAQGHLCVCCADFHNMSWLLVWILENYGTDN
jgi:hypothetical protein